MTTKHTHTANFGRRVADCPRCIELNLGAKPIQWRITRKVADTQLLAAIRAHDCTRSNCGPVCTAFDW